jgi:hypothetical protein
MLGFLWLAERSLGMTMAQKTSAADADAAPLAECSCQFGSKSCERNVRGTKTIRLRERKKLYLSALMRAGRRAAGFFPSLP